MHEYIHTYIHTHARMHTQSHIVRIHNLKMINSDRLLPFANRVWMLEVCCK